jgi:glycine/D-amino acid oxidase-like deaminating enzyme
MPRFDVVVIGSGALGASAAFHLAMAGRSVALLDKAAIASQTSPRAAGLSGQLRRNVVMSTLARRSVEKLLAFGDETGEPMEIHQPGSMNIARTERHRVQLEKAVAWGQSLGFPIKALRAEEACERMPFLRPTGVLGATHLSTDVFLDPAQVPRGYAAAAAKLGAELHPHTRVDGFVADGAKVRRVLTDRGEFEADAVVDAAGAWARRLAELAGSQAPMVPMRHQLMVTAPIEGVDNSQPIVRVIDVNVYVRPDRGGLMLGGYERDPRPHDMAKAPAGFLVEDLELDLSVLRRLAESVSDQFPIFAEAPIQEHRGGLPTMTLDGEHIVGPAPGLDNLYLLAGCNVGGLSISPALGEEVANWILGGEPSLDLSRMSPARFPQGLSASELLARATERYAHYYSPPPVLPSAY